MHCNNLIAEVNFDLTRDIHFDGGGGGGGGEGDGKAKMRCYQT